MNKLISSGLFILFIVLLVYGAAVLAKRYDEWEERNFREWRNSDKEVNDAENKK